MAEYKNTEGWEASSKTRNYWGFIPMKESKHFGFEMPPLFKSVNPIIRLMIIGFIFIFILEGYATFVVAIDEGVPIEIICLLVFIDVFLAILPHLNDGKRTVLKNFKFIGEFSEEYLNLDESGKKRYQANYIQNDTKLKRLNIYRIFAYLPIIASAYAKIFLFFRVYPFFDTYQAYIIIISYSFGCLLHILCTGYVIMYWRFRYSLKLDRKRFGTSNGVINKTISRADNLISLKENVTLEINNENQNTIIQKFNHTCI